MELITFKVFDTAIEAHILKNRLEDEDILCFIFDENIVTLNPLLNFAVGGIRLQINQKDFEKAKGILAEMNDQPYTDDTDAAITCPNCDSTQLYSDFKTMKDAKGAIAWFTAFLLGIFPLYSKSVYRCKECDTEFEKTKKNKAANP
jgi:DNA-directed RNA polymerase subunit RPC12/RpoP